MARIPEINDDLQTYLAAKVTAAGSEVGFTASRMLETKYSYLLNEIIADVVSINAGMTIAEQQGILSALKTSDKLVREYPLVGAVAVIIGSDTSNRFDTDLENYLSVRIPELQLDENFTGAPDVIAAYHYILEVILADLVLNMPDAAAIRGCLSALKIYDEYSRGIFKLAFDTASSNV